MRRRSPTSPHQTPQPMMRNIMNLYSTPDTGKRMTSWIRLWSHCLSHLLCHHYLLQFTTIRPPHRKHLQKHHHQRRSPTPPPSCPALPRLQRPTEQHHHWRGSPTPPPTCPAPTKRKKTEIISSQHSDQLSAIPPLPSHATRAKRLLCKGSMPLFPLLVGPGTKIKQPSSRWRISLSRGLLVGGRNCHQRIRFFRHSLPPCLFISKSPNLLTFIETFLWQHITF